MTVYNTKGESQLILETVVEFMDYITAEANDLYSSYLRYHYVVQ